MGETHSRWTHRGFAAFQQGEFNNGGDNLYVTNEGAVEWIHRTDVNGDGHVDLVFPNSHGYDERGPTWIYTQPQAAGGEWGRRELPNDSGWMSMAADVDGDGYLDLIVVNAENGVTSELDLPPARQRLRCGDAPAAPDPFRHAGGTGRSGRRRPQGGDLRRRRPDTDLLEPRRPLLQRSAHRAAGGGELVAVRPGRGACRHRRRRWRWPRRNCSR